MRVTVRRQIVHQCPYRDETDVGMIEASWAEGVVELHAFAAYLDEWVNEKVTHEYLTEAIVEHLVEAYAEGVGVVTRWKTAGMDVEVSHGGE